MALERIVMICLGVSVWFVFVQATCKSFGYVRNGKVTVEGIDHTLGNRIILRIECNEGYFLSGAQFVSCDNNGHWTKRGYCKPLKCPKLQSLKSKCLGNVVIRKSSGLSHTVDASCRKDVLSTDFGTRTSGVPVCFNNGSWSNENVGCLCHCKVVFDKGIVTVEGLSNGSHIPHGASINWSCNDGCLKPYDSIGTCTDGRTIRPLCWKANPTQSINNTAELSEYHDAYLDDKTAPGNNPTNNLTCGHTRDIVLYICITLIVIFFITAVVVLSLKKRNVISICYHNVHMPVVHDRMSQPQPENDSREEINCTTVYFHDPKDYETCC